MHRKGLFTKVIFWLRRKIHPSAVLDVPIHSHCAQFSFQMLVSLWAFFVAFNFSVGGNKGKKATIAFPCSVSAEERGWGSKYHFSSLSSEVHYEIPYSAMSLLL